MATEQAQSGQPKDLMSYLLDSYLVDAMANNRAIDIHAAGGFAAFGQKLLASNQPVSVEYLTGGLGLKLQDATVVTFVPPTAAPPGMSDAVGYMNIGSASPGKGTAAGHSQGITGVKHG